MSLDGATGTTALWRDSELIYELADWEITPVFVLVPPERSTYRFDISARREVPFAQLVQRCRCREVLGGLPLHADLDLLAALGREQVVISTPA